MELFQYPNDWIYALVPLTSFSLSHPNLVRKWSRYVWSRSITIADHSLDFINELEILLSNLHAEYYYGKSQVVMHSGLPQLLVPIHFMPRTTLPTVLTYKILIPVKLVGNRFLLMYFDRSSSASYSLATYWRISWYN